MAKDYLLTATGDLVIVNGDFSFGDSLDDDINVLLLTNQGEVKQDPFTGIGIVRMMRRELNQEQIQKRVKLQIERDGKNYEEIRSGIAIRTND